MGLLLAIVIILYFADILGPLFAVILALSTVGWLLSELPPSIAVLVVLLGGGLCIALSNHSDRVQAERKAKQRAKYEAAWAAYHAEQAAIRPDPPAKAVGWWEQRATQRSGSGQPTAQEVTGTVEDEIERASPPPRRGWKAQRSPWLEQWWAKRRRVR